MSLKLAKPIKLCRNKLDGILLNPSSSELSAQFKYETWWGGADLGAGEHSWCFSFWTTLQVGLPLRGENYDAE